VTLTTEWADRLEAARRDRAPIERATPAVPALTLAEAYAVQDELTTRREAAGDRVIGTKLGLTSRAKQAQMGVAEPVYGRLFAGTLHGAESPLDVGTLIHPRVEPEIVFAIGQRLAGPGVTTADVLRATTAVCGGLEIIDSRFANYSFTAADVVADNTSEAKIVLGPRMVPPADLDLSLVGVLLEVDGELVATAAGAATLGHPAEAVASVANWLGSRGQAIEAGWLVLSGSLTAAVPLVAGSHVTATFGHLGSVRVRGI
jgi:2-oxo-3-hexenedioate decarboxylase